MTVIAQKDISQKNISSNGRSECLINESHDTRVLLSFYYEKLNIYIYLYIYIKTQYIYTLCFPIPQGQVCFFSVLWLCDRVALSCEGRRDTGWSLGCGVAGPFRSSLPWLTRFSEFPLSFRDSGRYTEGVSIQRLPLIWQWLQGVKTCWEPAREGGDGGTGDPR